MPGPLLHVGAVVTCAHGGQATPTVINPRVMVNSQPTVLFTTPYAVVGCALPPPPGANGPCVTAQFVTAALRLSSNGQPLLLQDSQSVCVPTGTPLLPVGVQPRVTGM